ncbi:hypothetical protein SMAC4_13445 [Sordaria macrospora]|uniref:uncharacterized protein n=1 Tax=Sordaria macrospora TaxID=5147 RepID=UPI002B306942|nr:hypothetical protein SMAC4_13445 [Sordaria macrospora]
MLLRRLKSTAPSPLSSTVNSPASPSSRLLTHVKRTTSHEPSPLPCRKVLPHFPRPSRVLPPKQARRPPLLLPERERGPLPSRKLPPAVRIPPPPLALSPPPVRLPYPKSTAASFFD